MNYWCKDLHLGYIREFWKHHHSLSLLLLYQKTLFLLFVATDYYKTWKKERKVVNLTDCKLKCFSSRIYASLGCINGILRYINCVGLCANRWTKHYYISALAVIMRFLMKCLVLKHKLDLFVYRKEQICQ